MSALRFALLTSLVLVIGTAASAREEKAKIDKTKIVGTWKLIKTDSKTTPADGLDLKIELTKDGKMTLTMKVDGKTRKASGVYTVKGDQWTSVLKTESGKELKETVTITVLTDKKLVTTEDENGKTVTAEFKK
jgi:uncharacterized protein (TIGR03066 family)